MKKLSLKNLKLEVDDLLQRNELKAILGGGYGCGNCGGGPSDCTADCIDAYGNPSTVTCSGQNCQATDYWGCTSDQEHKRCPW